MSTYAKSQMTRWIKGSGCGAAFAVVVTLLLLPASAKAQQALTCDQARSTLLSSGGSRAQLIAATATIIRCGDIAPATVATALRRATPNTTRDTLAQFGAASLFDRRLLDSVRVLALDYSQPTARRQAYLHLLTRYASPIAAIDVRSLDRDDAPKVLGAGDGEGGVDGTQPLGVDGRNLARATIQTMGWHDPDPRLRKLANLVGEQLQAFMQ
jgi:hypothetical protein